MKHYTIHAQTIAGAKGISNDDFLPTTKSGPFHNRAEAERTAQQMLASGQFRRATVAAAGCDCTEEDDE